MGLPSLIRPIGSRTAAAGALVDDLRELAQARERQVCALWDALERFTPSDLFDSLSSVIEPLPLVVDADCAMVRVSDDHGMLHLVAASGCVASELRMRAMQPVEVRVARRLADPETVTRHGHGQGFRWAQLRWLGRQEAPIGSIVLASRTDRRPQPLQLELLSAVTTSLTERLMIIDRRVARLRACALRLARSVEPPGRGALAQDEVANLRPRERSILELYADGLGTKEIASLLFISPHTVRTHVKTALRTLGLHHRTDAARAVRSSQLGLLF